MTSSIGEFDLLNGSDLFPYPVTISREDFQGEKLSSQDEFDVDEYLYKNHRFTSIDSLIKDLQNLSKGLNQELLDLVNDDYNDFIELGKSINGGLELINGIKMDLKNFNQELITTSNNFTVSQETLTYSLDKKKQLIQLKTKIKLLLLLNDQIDNFETLLNFDIDSEHSNTSNEKMKSNLKNLTTLYLSFSKLNDVLSMHSIIFVENNLKQRVSSLKFEFKSYLDELLTKVLRQDNSDSKNLLLFDLMNIYRIIGHESDFIKVSKRAKTPF